MSRFVTLAELAGFSAVVYGVYLLAPWAAWIVGGVILVVAAAAMDGSDT